MKAMILKKISDLKENRMPLDLVDIPIPEPNESEVRIKISVCGVCHTELDEIEGRLMPPELPVVLGHQVVGLVEKLGLGATKFQIGDRVGVAWIFSACGKCKFVKKVMRTFVMILKPLERTLMAAMPNI